MSAHTPGPWVVVDGTELGPQFRTRVRRGESGLELVQFGNVADANLAAAAPDLLAACHALLAAEPLLGELCDGACKPGLNHHVSGCAVGLALAAIAKAEGRT